jgi:hypothetical protein
LKLVKFKATVVITDVPPAVGVPFRAIENDFKAVLNAPEAVLKVTPFPATSAVAVPAAKVDSAATSPSFVQEKLKNTSANTKVIESFMAIKF